MIRRTSLAVAALAAFASPAAQSQEKVTFQDHIMPIVEANCAKCHSSDKKKGDLDLTSYSAALAGAASGKIVAPGDPEASKLWKVINHTEEPTMPPSRGKMADKDLAVFKKWIAGGLLETSGSKAIAGKRPAVDLTLSAAAVGKPDGPPPMPGDLLLEPSVTVKRSSAVTGLAASPWAPLLAVAGQKQVALYHTDSLNLLGILPFSDGAEAFQPTDVRFSRNGKLLVVAGGHAAKAGRVAVFDINTGERIILVGQGQEFDSVLTADISPDQTKIAAGGPSRMVRVYSTSDGSVLFKMKKHTDWVTALAFSPNGEYLATGDRNGGITIWDADNGIEVHTVAGHKGAVTALSWRGDSRLLSSTSEDGSTKVWETAEGKQVRTANTHAKGALSVHYAHDGRTVSCGRDNQIVAWTADGAKQRAFTFTNDLPVRAVFAHDGKRVFAADWAGHVYAWNSEDAKPAGELAANPPPIAKQLEVAERRLKELENGATGADAEAEAANAQLEKTEKNVADAKKAADSAKADAAAKEAEVERLKAAIAKATTPELEAKLADARKVRNAARLEITNAVAKVAAKTTELEKAKKTVADKKAADPAVEIAELKSRIARLKAGQVYASVYRTRESIAARKREQEKLLASGDKADKIAAEKLANEITRQEAELKRLSTEHAKLKTTQL